MLALIAFILFLVACVIAVIHGNILLAVVLAGAAALALHHVWGVGIPGRAA